VIVADASVLVEMFLRTDAGKTAEEPLFRRGESIHVPALLDVEVTQVLRRYVMTSQMPATAARAAVNLLSVLPMERYLHDPLLPRIWELRENLTAYDAAYVALAEALRAPLYTADAKLAKASGLRALVELLR
jgi:predicted nucleic acid-binding protein